MSGQVYRDIVGSAAAVQASVKRLADAGELAAVAPPRPVGDRWRVRVWLHQPVEPVRVPPIRVTRTQLVARPARRFTCPSLPRDAGMRIVVAAFGVGVLAGLVWLVWQALSGAARVASANAVWLIPVALAVVIAGLMALSTKRGSQRGHRCAGVRHCPSCNGH